MQKKYVGNNNHDSFLNNLFGLYGKTALVTGCAGGIGFALCDGLSKSGANIIGLSNASDDSPVKNIVEQNGRSFYSYKTDLIKNSNIDDIFNNIIKSFPQIETIDILINNAGINQKVSACSYLKKDWDNINQINLTIPFFLCKSYYTYLINLKKAGSIINILSLRSFHAGYKSSGYTITKHGLLGLTKSLANEWGVDGIRVNAIAPGYINTKMIDTFVNSPAGLQFINTIGLKRFVVPADLIGAVIFLSSNASNYINGETIIVDGGIFISPRDVNN